MVKTDESKVTTNCLKAISLQKHERNGLIPVSSSSPDTHSFWSSSVYSSIDVDGSWLDGDYAVLLDGWHVAGE